jgi:hypothetical protein
MISTESAHLTFGIKAILPNHASKGSGQALPAIDFFFQISAQQSNGVVEKKLGIQCSIESVTSMESRTEFEQNIIEPAH